MKELNRKYLKKAIAELPEMEANDAIWDNILAKSSVNIDYKEKNKENLNNAINDLPDLNAPDEAWNKISQTVVKKKSLPIRKLYLSISAAAAVLAITFIVLKNTDIFQEGKIEYSTEIIFVDDEADIQSSGDDKINDYLSHNCKNLPLVCENPKFKDLNLQLNELETEENKLRKVIEQNNEPQLKKYLYRIENDKVGIQKELMQMFM